MENDNLEDLFKANGIPAERGAVIRETIDALASLRENGLPQKGYSLVAPFGRRTVSPPSKSERLLQRSNLK